MVRAAEKAMEFSYSPYSNFKVGAALLCSDGTVFSGCNVENVSYGASNCAERTAVFKAVSEGHRSFEAIAIVSSSGDFTPPCGICRQVLSEFSPSMTVVLSDKFRNLRKYALSDLLPASFSEIK